jgi:signal transduction histidine kinase
MNPQGHGFGLSICLDIAKLLNGSISCRSELGQGTCFTFSFQAEEVFAHQELV